MHFRPDSGRLEFRRALLAVCLTAAAAWFLTSGCASYTPSHGAMRTNAPTVPPLVGDLDLRGKGVVATGGLRVEQTLVEHRRATSLGGGISEGVWTTSPMGGWGQLEFVPGSDGARGVVGVEYGAGWSAWVGPAAFVTNPGNRLVTGFSMLVGVTRRQTHYWGDSVVNNSRLSGEPVVTVPGSRRDYGGLHMWMCGGLHLQHAGSGPWGEARFVPLYSWGGQLDDGFFSIMGTLAAGWHQPVGERDRIVVGWRGLATGYTMSNQGMLLWQHRFGGED